jgi:hypothetical protein
MQLHKGIIYPRQPNTDDGIKLNKGIVYISAWAIDVGVDITITVQLATASADGIAPTISATVSGLWEVLDIDFSEAQLGVSFTETEYGISFDLSEYGVSLEVALLPTEDNTVRFTTVFSNLAGAATDLDALPVLTVYDAARSLLATSTMIRSAAGTYYADYVVEADAYAYAVEGLLGGEQVVGRASITPTWFTEE